MKYLSLVVRQMLRLLPGYQVLKHCYKKVIQTDDQWLRVVMNQETKKIVKDLNPKALNVLEISGSNWGEWEDFRSYKSVYYPDFDICETYFEETFDLITAEQVFEHLLWPYRAGRNVYKMLNAGGYFLVTTPFLIRVHNEPTDCSRWTETGMKHFLAECGFDLSRILTGSWGNRDCMIANLSKWAKYRPMFHSLRNEPNIPMVVWALAQK